MGFPNKPDKSERRMVKKTAPNGGLDAPYRAVFGDVSKIIDAARESAARSVNAAMTAAYWLIGRRIVEFEQSGEDRAEYGAALVERLAEDLAVRFGRGFSLRNIYNMRLFYLAYPTDRILQTPSAKLAQLPERQILQTPSGKLEDPLRRGGLRRPADGLPAALVRLRAAPVRQGRERPRVLRGRGAERRMVGPADRPADRLPVLRAHRPLEEQGRHADTRGRRPRPEDPALPGEQIKDPFVLEFLDLKDEYSESDLEEALIRHLETFLMELGDDFCFMGRQRRLRVGNRWYRVDLLFYHRGLRCLVVIDLKIGAFTHADAGQMHLYLNYARERWVREGENPPVGLILCSEKDEALAQYALEGLSNNVMAAEYRITLPDEKMLAAELDRTRQAMELRGPSATAGEAPRRTTRRDERGTDNGTPRASAARGRALTPPCPAG